MRTNQWLFLFLIFSAIAFLIRHALKFSLQNLNKESISVMASLKISIPILSILILLILTVHNTFYINNFNKYFNRISYFENCNTSNWILLKNKNGLKEWLPWTKKFDENFYKRICSDVLKKSI